MNVITISRQYASGGDEIAQLICQQASYRLFDKRLLSQAALDVGLSDQEIFDYSEDTYRIHNIFDRLFRRSAPVAELRVWHEDVDGTRRSELLMLDEEQAVSLVRRAVEVAYQAGDTVIVGRGGQVLLRDKPGVLHVRIQADLNDRLARVRQELKSAGRAFLTPLEDRRVAQDLIAANDAASADYLKRLYGVDWSDPSLYHLVINASRLSFEEATQVILAAARELQPELA